MKFRDLFTMGLRNLWRRKTRTMLTLSSVAIGAACIIVMISLGLGMNQSYQAMLESMGSLTVIEVYPEYSDTGEQTPVNEAAMAKIEQIPHVQACMPYMYVHGFAASGKQMSWFSVMAMDLSRAKYFDFALDMGELPDGEDADYLNVYLAGCEFANSFQNPKNYSMSEPIDPMEEEIIFFFDQNYDYEKNKMPKKKDGYKAEIAGIIRQYQNQQDYTLYMDISTYKKMAADKAKADKKSGNTGNNSGGGGVMVYGNGRAYSSSSSSFGNNKKDPNELTFNNFQVKVDDMKHVADVSAQLNEMGYYTYALTDYLNELQGNSGTMQAILGGVGIVSLIISAIGITNTMVMAIYERTKEIGIMKVIGARIRDIKRLFLFEAAVIGFVGGVLGLVVSVIASVILNQSDMSLTSDMSWLDQSGTTLSVIPMWLYALGLLFSTLVGIISGFQPARRAATKISALEAIRSE